MSEQDYKLEDILSDYSIHNTTCYSCHSRMNPDAFDAGCNQCHNYFCEGCIIERGDADSGGSICYECKEEQEHISDE